MQASECGAFLLLSRAPHVLIIFTIQPLHINFHNILICFDIAIYFINMNFSQNYNSEQLLVLILKDQCQKSKLVNLYWSTGVKFHGIDQFDFLIKQTMLNKLIRENQDVASFLKPLSIPFISRNIGHHLFFFLLQQLS